MRIVVSSYEKQTVPASAGCVRFTSKSFSIYDIEFGAKSHNVFTLFNAMPWKFEFDDCPNGHCIPSVATPAIVKIKEHPARWERLSAQRMWIRFIDIIGSRRKIQEED